MASLIFWHMLRQPLIDDTLAKGRIQPTGYADLWDCETLRIRGKGVPIGPRSDFCTDHEHERPSVTWLCAQDLVSGPYAGQPAYLFRVNILLGVQRWKPWAQQHGANPEWVETRASWFQFTRECERHGGEWITTMPITRNQWLDILDLETGETVPVNATWVP